jgi:hypothetical protein
MRYLRQWKWDGREPGRFLVSAMPAAVLVLMIATEARAILTHQTMDQLQGKNMSKGSAEQHLLEMRSGRHVIFVRNTGPSPHLEWVYNPADIDAAPVIWAHDLGEAENERLRQYYTGRSFWLFEPDESMRMLPY